MAIASSQQAEALENLKVIRSLMERASVYRALSASAALFGGVLATAASAWGYHHSMGEPAAGQGPTVFALVWLVILALSGGLNVFLLCRDAQLRGQPFISDGLRMALRNLTPPLLSGGVLGLALIFKMERLVPAALAWIVCYGLALQATVSFAPKSIIRLARGFLISGQALTLAWLFGCDFASTPSAAAWLLMGLTFGLGHIIYAVAVFAGRQPLPTSPSPSAR